MPTHLEQSLQRDIDRIHAKVCEMRDLIETSLRNAMTALLDANRQIAYAVILRDDLIDEKEKELDRLCLEFLVRQQPVAGKLRFAYSTIKMNQEMEQIGDYSENISRQALKIGELPDVVSRERFKEISDMSIKMFGDAIEAYLTENVDLARRTMAVEQTVDALKSRLNTDLVDLYKEGKIPFDVLRPLTTIARRMERVTDRCRNICMEIIYMCTGEYAKHEGSDIFRVLFVDRHNACRSVMAEAIANGLNQPLFIFSSAGLDPTALDNSAINFMREKGYDISRSAPKGILQVPYLDHYQVIVGLDPEVQRAFPRLPRKVVFLDWSGTDPCGCQGNEAEVKKAFDCAFKYFETHIHDLVEAILGTKVNG